jgi:hypothetical protein
VGLRHDRPPVETTRARVIVATRLIVRIAAIAASRRGEQRATERMGGVTRELSGVDRDLVEYLVVALPDLDAVAAAVPAMLQLEVSGAVRILDWVVVGRDAAGLAQVPSLEVVAAALHVDAIDPPSLLSDHDVAVAADMLPPGSLGLVVVAEDRWARPLSDGLASVGGRIIAGERIPRERVEEALVRRPPAADG